MKETLPEPMGSGRGRRQSDARLNWTAWAGLPLEAGQMPALDIDVRPAP